MSERLSRGELLQALREFAAEIGEIPTRTQMNEEGPYSSQPYYREFGGWNDALEAAGLGTNHRNGVPDEELLAELQRLDDELARVPRFEDMNEVGAFSAHTYVRRWGSWPDAKSAAGLCEETRTSRRIEREELVEALRELADELGTAPTQEEMNDLGRFSQRPFYREWDSWAEATRAAGLDPNHQNDIPEDVLLDALRELSDELGHTPTRREMNEQGRFTSEPYITTFGSWTNAWDAADLEQRTWYPSRASEEELLEALHDLADDLGRVPTRGEMEAHGEFSREPFARAFGTWSAALKAAGFEPYRLEYTDGEYLYYGASWLRQRQRALLRDQYRCQECGMTDAEHRREFGQGLEVHHRSKFQKFEDHETANQLSNLVTLCRPHHRMRERRDRL